MNAYKRILTVQDISCIGQCSLTVALPILSACGVETGILPSAVLSTHTGGFSGYTFRDLTEDMPGIMAHWEKEGIRFDAFYTGYLGSEKQIGYVRELFARLPKEGALRIVDPAMADNGKLYYGFDESFAASMATLCGSADIILPNITEACYLTKTPYREKADEAFVDELLSKLTALGAGSIVMTGVAFTEGKTGVLVYENGKKWRYEHEKISKGCHGTGDVYASAFVGALLNGKSKCEAAQLAADYVVDCIRATVDDPQHWYGVKFEIPLGTFARRLGR